MKPFNPWKICFAVFMSLGALGLGSLTYAGGDATPIVDDDQVKNSVGLPEQDRAVMREYARGYLNQSNKQYRDLIFAVNSKGQIVTISREQVAPDIFEQLKRLVDDPGGGRHKQRQTNGKEGGDLVKTADGPGGGKGR